MRSATARRALLAALGSALYLPLLANGRFVGDAYLYVAHGAKGATPTKAAALLASPFLGATAPYWRPVTTLVECVEASLFGTAPLPYLALGLALHLATALLLGSAVAAFGRRVGRAAFAERTAFLVSLLYTANPIALDVVADVAARGDGLAALLLAGALRAHLGAGPRDRFFAAALFALAVLAKESAFVFPLAALLLDLLYPEGPRRVRRAIARALPYALVLAAAFLARRAVLGVAVARFPLAIVLQELGLGVPVRSLARTVGERFALFHFPVNERSVEPAVRALLLAGLLGVEAVALWTLRREWRAIGKGLLATAVAVVLLQGPAIAVAVDHETLARSRHLLLAAGGHAAALGILLANLRAPLLAAAAPAAFAVLALANEGPWVRSMKQFETFRAEVAVARDRLDPAGSRAVLLDAPGHLDGALFFQPGSAPAFSPPFLDPGLELLPFSTEQFLEFDRAGGPFREALDEGLIVLRVENDGNVTSRRFTAASFEEVPGSAEGLAGRMRDGGEIVFERAVPTRPARALAVRFAQPLPEAARVVARWRSADPSALAGGEGSAVLPAFPGDPSLRLAALDGEPHWVLAERLVSLGLEFDGSHPRPVEIAFRETPPAFELLSPAEGENFSVEGPAPVLSFRPVPPPAVHEVVATLLPALVVLRATLPARPLESPSLVPLEGLGTFGAVLRRAGASSNRVLLRVEARVEEPDGRSAVVARSEPIPIRFGPAPR